MPVGSRGDSYVEDTVALGTVTVAGTHAVAGSFGSANTLLAQLSAGAPTGTSPTLNAQLEHSVDGTNWHVLATFAQLTAAVRLDFKSVPPSTPFGQRLRLNITGVGGTTPSFPNVTLVVASQTPQA